eukprot:COSAG02_NODE_21564_length_783_cov_0.852339_1_plen_176_part_01
MRALWGALAGSAMIPGAIESANGGAPAAGPGAEHDRSRPGGSATAVAVTDDELSLAGTAEEQAFLVPRPPLGGPSPAAMGEALATGGRRRRTGSNDKHDAVRAADDTAGATTMPGEATALRITHRTRSMVAMRSIVAMQRMETEDSMLAIYKQVDTSGNGLMELDEFKQMIKLCSL